MPITQVCKFRTDDGQEFDTKNEARAHEVFRESKMDLIEILSPAYRADRADAVITSMLMLHNAEAVRDLLNRHLRRQPRKTSTDDES